MSTSPSPHAPSATQGSPESTAGGSRWYVHLVVDVVLVLLFAALGRSSHGEDLAGVLTTTWPFLTGLLAGWLVCLPFRRPTALLPSGVIIWLCTEAGGMVLRALTGQGTAFSFVVVSAVVLAVFLLGHRLVLALVRRTRARSRTR